MKQYKKKLIIKYIFLKFNKLLNIYFQNILKSIYRLVHLQIAIEEW